MYNVTLLWNGAKNTTAGGKRGRDGAEGKVKKKKKTWSVDSDIVCEAI